MAIKNTGKPSEKQFEDRLTSAGKSAYFYRIKDASAIRGLTGKIGHVDATPCDYIITVNGLTSYAEVKSTINESSFPFSMLKKGQNAHGERILRAGGSYLIFIHRLDTDIWYCISRQLVDTIKRTGRNSVRWDEIEQYIWS